ncbi:MAG: Bug family tripartite tricarboxylate transporter substrate binding protein [Burkholderiales bacterium]
MKTPLRFLALLAIAMGYASIASAQPAYPSKPVRIVVPSAPGGANSIFARIVADRLQAALGQPFLVDNRGGAGGLIGTDIVAKSAPDGYTLLLTYGGPISTGLALFKSVPYDAARDFTPITRIADVPIILVSSPAFGPKTVKDLIAHAHANPGRVTASINSIGAMGHLMTEQFILVTKSDLNKIPYKGSGPALVDLFGGQINITFDTLPITLPHIKAGRLHPHAIATATRSEQVPDVPTFTELGMPALEVTTWFALVAPTGTPKPIIDRLQMETAKILQSGDVKELLAKQGAIARTSTPLELAQFMRQESEKWSKIIKDAGIQAE